MVIIIIAIVNLYISIHVFVYRKCDVNTADGEGTTSLHYCGEYNRPDIIK